MLTTGNNFRDFLFASLSNSHPREGSSLKGKHLLYEQLFVFKNVTAIEKENINKSNRLRGLTGGFLLLRNFRVTISASPHVCFILV